MTLGALFAFHPIATLYAVLSSSSQIGAAVLDSKVHFSLSDVAVTHWIGDFEWNVLKVVSGATLLLVNNPDDPMLRDLLLDLSFVGQTASGMTFEILTASGTYEPPVDYRRALPYGTWPNEGDTDGVCDLPFQRFALAIRGFEFCCGESYSIDVSLTCAGSRNWNSRHVESQSQRCRGGRSMPAGARTADEDVDAESAD
jgi:hypothetical protein